MSTITQFPSGNTQYRIEFDYLARTFVVVTLVNSSNPTLNRVLEVGRDYRFLNPTMIEMLVDQSGFDIVRIHRQTGTDLVVDFRNGSVLTASDLTNAELQAIHIAEEGRDQTVDLAKEYADAAGSSAGNAKDSEDEARRIAASIKASGQIGYITRRSFEEGFNVTTWNEVLLWEEDGEYYRWDGTLPKNVPAGSTPETSGGIGIGAWLSVGGATAVEYFNKLISFETPEKFGASSIFNPEIDDTPFVQAAIDAAEASGGSGVVLLSRKYKLIDAPQTFTTPGDDGTVYPGWVGNGDENLQPQTRYTQQFHLKIHSGTRLVGLNKSCGFTGTWDFISGPIDIGQPGMLLVTTDNPYYGTLINQVSELTCTNFFTGIIAEGIIFQSEYKNLKFKYTGFPLIAHGCENSRIHTIDCGDCCTGIIVGGWWTTRNRIAGNDGSGMYVQPYDGTGGALLGWCDGLDVYDISYSVAVRPWGDRHVNIDTYFNKHFYNRAYSALTSEGGRASNSTNSADTATYPAFPGVTSRALTILSRNGHNNSNNNVHKLRTNGTHRAPLFVNRSNLCTVTDAHVERSGWVDAGNRGKIFGVDVQDPYRSAGYIQPVMSEGFITVGKDYHTPSSVSSKPLTETTWTNYRYSSTLDPASDHRGSASYPEQIVWTQRGSGTYEKILSRVVNRNSAGVTDVYVKNMDYYRMPAPYIGANAFTLQHSQGTFTPVLYVGDTVVAATGASGFYERIGDTIRCTINWYNYSVDIQSLSGQISIQGMPVALTPHNGSNFPAITVGYLTAPNAYGITGSMSGTTLRLRKQNHTANLTASDFTAGTVAHFVQLTVEYTVASVSP